MRQEFLEFFHVDHITGKFIATTILQAIEKLGLSIENVVGQSYDGAPNMSSEKIGVQTRIKKYAPKALYVHCNSHCLNLVVGHSCKIQDVRNMLDRLKDVCLFFLSSPKRNGLLTETIMYNTKHDLGRRKALLDLCKTRWAMRHKAYQHFFQSYDYIVESLESIVYGTSKSEAYSNTTWNADSKRDALALLNSITSFDFIITFVTTYQYLSHLQPITVKLQGRAIDIVEAYNMVQEIINFYISERNTVDKSYEDIYQEAVLMGKKINVEPSMPRIAQRQVHRNNVKCPTPLIFYKINLAIPLLDSIVSNLKSQFTGLEKKASSLMSILPPFNDKEKSVIEELKEFYHDELPAPELLHQEMKRWRAYFEPKQSELPSTPAAALKMIEDSFFPNISVLLRIAATLPVTSCECERSASSLRRLNNYVRATMSEERKSSLALMHIHYNKNISIDSVIDIFASLHPRKLQLENIFKD